MSINNNLEQPTQASEEELLINEIRSQAEEMKSSINEPESTDVDIATQDDSVQKANDVSEDVDKNDVEGDTSSDDNVNEEGQSQDTKTKQNPEDIFSKDFDEEIVLKSRGLKVPVKNMKELIQFGEKGLDYIRKTQEIAPFRKIIEMMQNAGVDEADIQMLADIKSGNKTAINGFASKYNIDLLDVDSEAQYKPQVNIPVATEADEVARDIMANKELHSEFTNVVQYVPQSFKEILAQDAKILRGFAIDVEHGIAQKLLPEANKIMILNPGVDFISAYRAAGERLIGSKQEVQSVETKITTPIVNRVQDTSADKKQKAGISSGSSGSKDKGKSLDIWENGLDDNELTARVKALSAEMQSRR